MTPYSESWLEEEVTDMNDIRTLLHSLLELNGGIMFSKTLVHIYQLQSIISQKIITARHIYLDNNIIASLEV